MLLMWLGPLALMFFGIEMFRRSLERGLEHWQRPFLRMPASVSTPGMLARGVLAALAQAAIRPNQCKALELLDSQRISRRFAILLFCLAACGAWSHLLIASLMGQISGFYLLAIAVVFYLSDVWLGRGGLIAKILGSLGVALVGAEAALRSQSILLSVLGESEWSFLLADGRWGAQLLWFAVAVLVTLLFSVEAWSLFVSLLLVAAGSLSLNGAMALMLGESLATALWLAWKGRPFGARALKANILSVVLAFFLCGWWRESLAADFSADLSQVTLRTQQVVIFYGLILAMQTLVLMIWGHFEALRPDETPSAKAVT